MDNFVKAKGKTQFHMTAGTLEGNQSDLRDAKGNSLPSLLEANQKIVLEMQHRNLNVVYHESNRGHTNCMDELSSNLIAIHQNNLKETLEKKDASNFRPPNSHAAIMSLMPAGVKHKPNKSLTLSNESKKDAHQEKSNLGSASQKEKDSSLDVSDEEMAKSDFGQGSNTASKLRR